MKEEKTFDIEMVFDMLDDFQETLETLRTLHDLQNGPPSIDQENTWLETMQKSEKVLQKYEK